MKRVVLAALAALLVSVGAISVAPTSVPVVEADHGVTTCGTTGTLRACLAKTSAFVREYIIPQREVTWCINARGLQYPGFRDQTVKTMARWSIDLQVPHREVPWATDGSCTVLHSVRDDHPCSGCGAWIYYGNLPMLIEYNARAGIVNWLTTDGHEYGHGACLLDEHYDKVGFRSFILTFGYWIHGAPTVMDVGTYLVAGFGPDGIWYLTEYDIDRCEETLGRSLSAPDPCDGFYSSTHPWMKWEPCLGRWVNTINGWSIDPSTGAWYDPNGVLVWGACNQDRLRWHHLNEQWDPNGTRYYKPALSAWVEMPACP